MTSTYTPLGVEKMVTGENAGTWGTKTNTNLQLIEQISGGYAIPIIADPAEAAGNSIVKVPLVTVLSPPNAMVQHAGSPDAVSLKIKQPLAVNEADVHEILAKSQTAVSVDKTGVTLVRAFPFAE